MDSFSLPIQSTFGSRHDDDGGSSGSSAQEVENASRGTSCLAIFQDLHGMKNQLDQEVPEDFISQKFEETQYVLYHQIYN
jgi:hypothetical protein